MGLFNFNKSSKEKDLKKLIKEKIKKDKEADKAWEQRLSYKYDADNLKKAKNMMLDQAKTIDSMEYEKITRELKERLNGSKEKEG